MYVVWAPKATRAVIASLSFLPSKESPAARWVSCAGVGTSEKLNAAVLQVLMKKRYFWPKKHTSNFTHRCCFSSFFFPPSFFRSYAVQQPVLMIVYLVRSIALIVSLYCTRHHKAAAATSRRTARTSSYSGRQTESTQNRVHC